MERIAAVVVTYNRRDQLLRCIRALLAQRPVTPDILIVDNHSTDGTAAALETMIADGTVRYTDTGANLGGAGGFCRGMREAVAAGYTRLWIMDDDCIPDPDALEALRQADHRLGGEYGFLSGIARWREGSLCRMNVQKTGLHRKLTDPDAPLIPVIMATFVSAYIPAQRVREYGLPIADFFIWADDLEYTRRLSRHLPCYAVGGCRVLHDMQTNDPVDIATDTPERLPRYRCLYRNEVYLYRREGIRGIAYLLCRVGLHVLRVLRRGKNKRQKIRVILSSFAAGWRFRPTVEFPSSGSQEES